MGGGWAAEWEEVGGCGSEGAEGADSQTLAQLLDAPLQGLHLQLARLLGRLLGFHLMAKGSFRLVESQGGVRALV